MQENFNYDKLTRNYKENPLGRREPIYEEDLRYLFIDLLLPIPEITKIIGKKGDCIGKYLKLYHIERTPEQWTIVRKRAAELAAQRSMEKYGVRNPAQLDSVKDKAKKTCLEKYGVDNIQKLQETQIQKKETCLQKYGVDNPAKSLICKQKFQNTSMKKYGVTHPSKLKEVQEKQQQTMLDRYGVKFALQNPESLQKEINTNLQRYGEKFASMTEDGKKKIQDTCLEKYGFTNVMKSSEIQDKLKKTCLEKYGEEFPSRLKWVQDKIRKTCMKKYGVDNPSKYQEFKEKRLNTFITKYGVNNPMKCPEVKIRAIQKYIDLYGGMGGASDTVMQKIMDTKRKTGNGMSKPEAHILKVLRKKFGEDNVISQYKEERYPYYCDFYIKSLDLFIEYNGYISHYTEPFDITNDKHLEKLATWLLKAETIEEEFFKENGYLDRPSKYREFAYCWTISDPKKVNRAKANNLNFLVFYNMNQFNTWFNSITQE